MPRLGRRHTGGRPHDRLPSRVHLVGTEHAPLTIGGWWRQHETAVEALARAEAFGADRPAAGCRELTKTYEEVRRGGLGELAGWADAGLKGELTLVVQGALAVADELSPAALAALVRAREEAGTSRKDAIAEVVVATGRPKREVYDAVGHVSGVGSQVTSQTAEFIDK